MTDYNDNPYGEYSWESDQEYAFYERMNDYTPSQFEINRERYAAEWESIKYEGAEYSYLEEFGPWKFEHEIKWNGDYEGGFYGPTLDDEIPF